MPSPEKRLPLGNLSLTKCISTWATEERAYEGFRPGRFCLVTKTWTLLLNYYKTTRLQGPADETLHRYMSIYRGNVRPQFSRVHSLLKKLNGVYRRMGTRKTARRTRPCDLSPPFVTPRWKWALTNHHQKRSHNSKSHFHLGRALQKQAADHDAA